MAHPHRLDLVKNHDCKDLNNFCDLCLPLALIPCVSHSRRVVVGIGVGNRESDLSSSLSPASNSFSHFSCIGQVEMAGGALAAPNFIRQS